MAKKTYKGDPRDEQVSNEMLEHIADIPAGGSGEGAYVSGRIQSMARELLTYRNLKEN